jgi:hypothetical protein
MKSTGKQAFLYCTASCILKTSIFELHSLPPYLPRKVVIGSKYEDVRTFLKKSIYFQKGDVFLVISGSLNSNKNVMIRLMLKSV